LKPTRTFFVDRILAADVPEVLFCCIKDCTKVAMLGKNPYTDKQLVLTAICLLLGTRLYVQAFEGWDLLTNVDQTWIELQHITQEAFQWRLNATAPTAGHQGYAPAHPYIQKVFVALAEDEDNNDSADTVAIQVAALTLQSQATASTAANTSLQGQDHL
jgi:hypothetical protein